MQENCIKLLHANWKPLEQKKTNLRDRHLNVLWCTCQVHTRGREQSNWEDPVSRWLLGGRCTVMIDRNTWPVCTWLQFLLRCMTLCVPMPRHTSLQMWKWQLHLKLPACSPSFFLPAVSRILRDLEKIDIRNCRSDHYSIAICCDIECFCQTTVVFCITHGCDACGVLSRKGSICIAFCDAILLSANTGVCQWTNKRFSTLPR